MGGVNETISDGLGRYSIGEKLRTLRLRKSLGLVELGKHTGLSADLQEIGAEKAKPHSHSGVEFLFVIKGSVTIKIGSDDFTLEAEDAIYFDSAVQHSYRRRGSKPCSAVIVTVP